jgi:hypothetical protein
MMKEDKKEYYSLAEIVNIIKSFLRYLRKKWWMLLLSVLIGAALGLVAYFIQKPKYEAVATFILEERSQGGNGLSGLASQFGFDLGSLSGGGSIFEGDNILDILKSKKIVQTVLLSNVETTRFQGTLADFFLQTYGWKKNWSKVKGLENISFASAEGSAVLSPVQDSVLNVIHEHLLKKSFDVDRLNKKGTIIKVAVTSIDPVFAKLMSVRLIQEAGKLYLQIKTGTAQANINRMQNRADSLLALLNNRSYRAAASGLLDANPGINTANVPVEIASRDKVMVGTLYTEVVKNLEVSKMMLSQQTPIIQLLDEPQLPLPDTRRPKPTLILIGVFGCITFLIAFLAVKFLLQRPTND